MAKAERIFRDKFILTVGAAETSKEAAFIREGELSALFVQVPNFTNAVTVIVSIKDSDGYEFVVSSSLAKAQNHRVAVAWPLPGVQTIVVTVSGVPGGTGGDVVVVAFGRALG